MVWLEYGTLVNAACWLPLIVLLIELFFKNKNPLLIFLIPFCLAFSFFAGFPQTSFYVLFFSIIYFIYKLFVVKKIDLVRLGKLGGLVLLGFLGIISIQLLPFLEYLSLSTRNLVDSERYFSWSVLPMNLIGFIFPDFFGHPSKNLFWGRGNYQELSLIHI